MLTVDSKRRVRHRRQRDACAVPAYGPRAIHVAGKPTARTQSDCRQEQATQPQRTVRTRASHWRAGPARLWNEAASLAFRVHIRHPLASRYTVCAELHVNQPLICRRAPTCCACGICQRARRSPALAAARSSAERNGSVRFAADMRQLFREASGAPAVAIISATAPAQLLSFR
jgi:hypothetical protein